MTLIHARAQNLVLVVVLILESNAIQCWNWGKLNETRLGTSYV